MNILVISSYLPFPLHSGGDIRLYNLIKQLSKKHTITLICEKRDFQTRDDIREVEKICKEVITVMRHKQWSIKNILRTGLSDSPFLITGHTHTLMQTKIQKLLSSQKFDLIHIETSYVFQNLPVTDLPTVLVEHNIEYLVYDRFSKNASKLLRPFLQVDIKKLQKKEESFWKRASQVVVVSEREKQIVEKTGVHASVVPNGVDLTNFSVKEKKENTEKRILFIGDYKWLQNRDSARFIVNEIWPEIEKNTENNVKLWLVGRSMPEDLNSLGGDRIIATGPSESPAQELFTDAAVLLAPIRVGGGTQYKILEAMAVGTPVVTTGKGIEGIKVKRGHDILVSETAEGLAHSVINLLLDQKLYNQIAKNARNVIDEHYSWDKIADSLESVYKNTILKKV